MTMSPQRLKANVSNSGVKIALYPFAIAAEK
jgi:hypothetical protein